MNIYEKFGLVIILFYLNSTFPESWRGGEAAILYIGLVLFLLGSKLSDVIEAFRTVK